mgnify:FL=1
MQWIYEEHKDAYHLLNTKYEDEFRDVLDVIENTSEQNIIDVFKSRRQKSIDSNSKKDKSLSDTINQIFKESFESKLWKSESLIFNESGYTNKNWRLDFVKKDISLEVAFNHHGTVCWNLIKPYLASEQNHVKKEVETKISVIISATKEMQKLGGFDNAIGRYENYCSYLRPLGQILSVPTLIIGLKAPKTFKIVHKKEGRLSIGHIERL